MTGMSSLDEQSRGGGNGGLLRIPEGSHCVCFLCPWGPDGNKLKGNKLILFLFSCIENFRKMPAPLWVVFLTFIDSKGGYSAVPGKVVNKINY